MEIKYSEHLRFKLRVREIAEKIPERIYLESKQRYYNHHSLRRIAVMAIYHQRRRTLMMIAYDEFPEHVEIVTIHSITRSQIRERLSTGRWTHEKPNAAL